MKNKYKIRDCMPDRLDVGGWMHTFLEKQVTGMPGNLQNIGYPFDEPCWSSRSLTEGGKIEWWPYEQSAYWVDSMVRTAMVLHDPKALEPVLEQIEKGIADDGEPFLGPIELKDQKTNRCRWPQAVFVRALWAMYLYTGDEKYCDRMRAFYLADSNDYGTQRNIANAEMMFRLAEHYGDKALYNKAVRAMRVFDKASANTSPHEIYADKLWHFHGVTINEDIKMCAIAYLYTGDHYWLDCATAAYEKLASFYEMPDGLHTCYEYVTGNESFKAHESCDLTDHTYGLSFMLKATHDGKYADRIERIIYNALPGSIGPDYKSIQYFSGVNQVIVGRNSSWVCMWENSPKMTYQPHHYPECCVGNIGRAFPNFCLNMYGDTDTGLTVNFYGESSFKGENISVRTETQYPFDETVRISVTEAGKKNVLALRIPAWSKGYALTVNGRGRYCEVINGYIRLRVKKGDKIQLTFRFGLMPHHSSDGGIWYSYGPFTLALKLTEKWTVDTQEPRQTPDFPAWNVSTDDSFGYALSGYEVETAEIVRHPITDDNVFLGGQYPIEVKLKARVLDGWDYRRKANTLALRDEVREEDRTKNFTEGIDKREIECGATVVTDSELVLTPRLPSPEFVAEHLGGEKEITLVPYGCTCLRLTAFPKYDFEA